MSDNYLIPALTDEGISMLIRAMDGDSIKFTKFAFGDGVPNNVASMTGLANLKLEIGITDFEKKDGYLLLTGYCNSTDIEESFYAKELGVYAKDSNDIEKLYAYRYTEIDVDFFPAISTGRNLEISFSVVVQIGNAENVSAVLVESDAFVSKKDFQNHVDDKNPHNTTAEDIGASPKNHKHTASDITDGILPVTRGGTGVSSYQALANNLRNQGNISLAPVFGTYKGDGTQGRVINLGFTPKAVILTDAYGNIHDDINGYPGGIAIGNAGCCSQRGSMNDALTWNNQYTTLMIVSGGFKVNYYASNKVFSNMSGRHYRYIAFR